MGFFFSRKKKEKRKEVGLSMSSSGGGSGGKRDKQVINKSVSSTSASAPLPPPQTRDNGISIPTRHRRLSRQTSVETTTEPTMEMLPGLITDLRDATETSSDTPARALRMLFALSEHGHTENRTEMVRVADAMLVPTLLQFLDRCERGSSEQYLTLLVLNNISIPCENKRMIALEYDGAKVFARLLCDDPSCHLMAIVLVNLTFSEVDLRKELVSNQSGLELVDSLAFALRVASLTPEEYEARQPLIEGNEDNQSIKERLVGLMAEDQRLRPTGMTDLDYSNGKAYRNREPLVDPSHQLFPETARWCLAALKNLTRPSKDTTAANALIKTGTVPLILRFITIADVAGGASSAPDGSHSSSESPTPVDPLEEFTNSPAFWDSNSMQDAALFIVMNLAACAASRDYVKEVDAISILSFITEYRTLKIEGQQMTIEQLSQQDFQCMKARMALSYLVGSEGHFGQSRLSPSASTVYSSPDDSVLVLSEKEVFLLVELLSDTMHNRGKDGAGGYSAATFSVKYVLYALRCLLTHTLNQILVSKLVGVQLNSLLVKTLAQHSIQKAPTMDADAAEYSSFILYLQSTYGFQEPFLPSLFSSPNEKSNLTAKVLNSYLNTPNISPAGRHAAEQVLLRLKYLFFRGKITEVANECNPSVADLSFDDKLLSEAEEIHLEKRVHGARPRGDIFGRPILRSRAPRRGSLRGSFKAPWDNHASVSAFPSALHAVQQLSYGSTKVRHIDSIDDILIANNIASSANGEKTESYNYWWSWQDKANEIQRNLDRQRSLEASSVSLFGGSKRRGRSTDGKNAAQSPNGQATADLEPLSIFGLRCNMCAVDTTSW